jgi:GalNAc-alpha-(1->4)-GalNAc-alpha-(1->3)-diNAcBac-PP-undecaprenol alpha-1,4-N-acetyl-D-galactosaminyltransferase
LGTESLKKLLLVIPSLQAGGMERVMSELADYFVSKGGMEIHLLLYGIKREVFYNLPEKIVLHRPSFRFNNRMRLFSTLRTMLFLRRTVKKMHPDSVLSFGELWNSFVLLGLKGLKYPVFISDRCSPERPYNALHTFLRKWLYPHATGIIAQTATAKEIYSRQFGHGNIRVIGNPIREVERVNGIEKEEMVLMVGRLIRTKHQDELIKLFLEIGMPGWKLVIVGYDHLKQNNRQRLQEIIRANGAEERVFLEGKQARVDDYYTRSRIFAFTSSSEGFPNAIGEAMSAGLPVVAFDCVAGPSDMIRDGENGFLVPLFDYDLFRRRLESLMKDGDLQESMGSRGREDIRAFSIQKTGERFLEFILEKNNQT